MRACMFRALALVSALWLLHGTTHAIDIVAFSTDFESGVPAELTFDDGWAHEMMPVGDDRGAAHGLPAMSFADFGFSGDNWLISQGGGKGPTASFQPLESIFKTATLELTGLPLHASIDLNFLLTATDSIDRGDSGATDGPFKVRIDGDEIFSVSFANSGNIDQGGQVPDGIVDEIDANARLVEDQNLTAWLRFPDDANGNEDPTQPPHSWTLDSGYDMGVLSVFNEIPHTSSTLTVEFLHSMSSGDFDEAHAIDDLEVILNDAGGTLGDANGDDLVNLEDFEIIRQNFFQAAASAADGDVNFDGFVNLGDFRLWKDNQTGAAAAAGAVPEPASLALLALVCGALLVYRKLR